MALFRVCLNQVHKRLRSAIFFQIANTNLSHKEYIFPDFWRVINILSNLITANTFVIKLSLKV